MITKNLIKGTIVCLSLAAAPAAFAQSAETKNQPAQPEQRYQPAHPQTAPGSSPKERVQRETGWMQQNLEINGEQRKKANSILLHYYKQVEGAKNSGVGDKEGEIRGIKGQRDAALKDVLNSEQYQKYQQHLQDMQQSVDDRSAGGMK